MSDETKLPGAREVALVAVTTEVWSAVKRWGGSARADGLVDRIADAIEADRAALRSIHEAEMAPLREALERIIVMAFHQTGADTLQRCLWCFILASVEKLRPQGAHYDGCPVGIAGRALATHTGGTGNE
jgi:hypothetical protein